MAKKSKRFFVVALWCETEMRLNDQDTGKALGPEDMRRFTYRRARQIAETLRERRGSEYLNYAVREDQQ